MHIRALARTQSPSHDLTLARTQSRSHDPTLARTRSHSGWQALKTVGGRDFAPHSFQRRRGNLSSFQRRDFSPALLLLTFLFSLSFVTLFLFFQITTFFAVLDVVVSFLQKKRGRCFHFYYESSIFFGLSFSSLRRDFRFSVRPLFILSVSLSVPVHNYSF